MAIPDYESLMLPLLEEITDGAEVRVGALRERVSGRFEFISRWLEA